MAGQLKVSFILPGGGPSGGVRATVAIANELFERGHDVRVFYHKGVGIKTIVRNAVRGTLYGQGSNWLSQLKCQARSFSLIERITFDPGEIVVGMGLWSCRELQKVRQKDVLKVHYVHGEVPWDKEFMGSAWCEPVPKIAVASYLAGTVKNICDQEILAVVPNGVYGTEYYPTTTEDQRGGVGTIYGAGAHKDPQMALAVLKTLRSAHPEVPLRVFGSARPRRDMEVSEYTRLPSIQRARDIYSRCRIWLLCSRSEGFGMPILEAMACGCVVVATDCGGPKDIIQDGENGFLVDIGDVEGMVEKVRLLLQDPDLCRSMAEQGRRTAEWFSWDRCVGQLESVLVSLKEGTTGVSESGTTSHFSRV